MDQAPEVLESHPGRRVPPAVSRAAVAVTAVLAAVGATGYVLVERRPEPVPSCGVEGHPQWCRAPSQQITGPALARVVRSYCPDLARATHGRLQPQPLRLAHLAAGGTLAIRSGRPGTEDALLGTRRDYAWVTRWIGGRYDGRVDVRCPAGSHQVPALALTREQYASTVAALADVTHRAIDFTTLARTASPTVTVDGRTALGAFSCDTTGVDLRRLRAGQRFTCQVEMFRLLGKGRYPREYVVTRSNPYVRAVTGSHGAPGGG